MSDPWEKAIRRYRAASCNGERSNASAKSEATFTQEDENARAFRKLNRQLTHLLSRYGGQARRLLEASCTHIVFAKSKDGDNLYIFTKDGLQYKTVGPAAKSKSGPISQQDAVELIIQYGVMAHGEDLIEWFIEKMNAIAQNAPA